MAQQMTQLYSKCLICETEAYKGTYPGTTQKEYSHGVCEREECIKQFIGISGLEGQIAEAILESAKHRIQCKEGD